MHDCWKSTPHNTANGGPLQNPADFWTSAEVDIISDYQTEPVRQWHERMARYLRSIDPYRHLITTSFARSPGDPPIDTLPEIDYVQTHHYSSGPGRDSGADAR